LVNIGLKIHFGGILKESTSFLNEVVIIINMGNIQTTRPKIIPR